jgi:predicted AlkP superfamily phosphohydrolase/phosphomutase
MKMMRRALFLSVVGTIVLLAALFLLKKLNKPSPGPVIIIGIDGADWNIMNPLLEQGKLPHLARLVEEGSSGVLETIRPTKSPVIWTSIATGKSMHKHGILDWVYVDENDNQIPYSGDDIKVKTFWKILGEENFRTGIINWFCTYPAEEVNGYVISDRFRLSIDHYLTEENVTYPEEIKDAVYPKVVKVEDRNYSELIAEEGIVDYWSQRQNFNRRPSKKMRRRIKFFRRFFLQEKSIENIALFLQKNVEVDVLALYFRLIDPTSHFASIFLEKNLEKKWRAENKDHGEPLPETEKLLYKNMAAIVEPVYVYTDKIIGRIVGQASENTTLIVVSDHGFNFSSFGYSHYETKKLANGIIIMKGPHIKAGYTLQNAHIYDITPTLLHIFSLPLGEDMDGKVLVDAFENQREVSSIPTYETRDKAINVKSKKALDNEMLEDLRSLGYIK